MERVEERPALMDALMAVSAKENAIDLAGTRAERMIIVIGRWIEEVFRVSFPKFERSIISDNSPWWCQG